MNRKRLAEFVRARLDEDAKDAERREERDLARFGGVPAYRNVPESPYRIRREVEAKRYMLAAWEHSCRMPGHAMDPTQHALEYFLLSNVILPMAAIYHDHPGYRREWNVRPRFPSAAEQNRERELALATLPPLDPSIVADLLGGAP